MAARSNKKKKSKSGKGKASSKAEWHRDLMWWLSTTATTVVVAGVFVGLIVGRGTMRSHAAAAHTQPVSVSFDWPTVSGDGDNRTWLDEESRGVLEAIATEKISPDPFDADSLHAAHDALMRTGWFTTPCRLKRTGDGVVRIMGNWRRPAAAVRWRGSDVIVSIDGERLPLVYDPDMSGRKIVIGAQLDPPPLGEAWAGGEVQAGIDLLAHLTREPWFDQVHAVDVSEFRSHGRLTLVTELGNRVRWGGRPGVFNPGEASDEHKLSRLTALYGSYGRIDARRGFVDVSLMHAPEVDDGRTAGGGP